MGFPPGNSGGPIEASVVRFHGRRVAVGFRRVIPAAPLKLGVAAGAEVARVSFRRVIPAAPLKLRTPRQSPTASPRSFRRVIPAAPLKRLPMRAAGGDWLRRFRRVIPAAPLKPEALAEKLRNTGWFPPGNSGGPIEAPCVPPPHSAAAPGFRRVIPAAPLKLPSRHRRVQNHHQFPPGNSGGPIEASGPAPPSGT